MFHTIKNLKLGNMRQAQDFLIYPKSDTQDYWLLQSDKRILKIDNEGNVKLSKKGNTFAHLTEFTLNENILNLVDTKLLSMLQTIDLSKAGYVTDRKYKNYDYSEVK